MTDIEPAASRVVRGEHTPGDLAQLDQARSAANQDLDNLLEAYRDYRDRHGEDAAHSLYVMGLDQRWQPLHVACALVAAMERLTRMDQ